MKTFADRLNYKLKQLGMTQHELGRKSGVSQSAIYKLVNGLTLAPKNALQIADALGVNVRWLSTGEGEMDKSPTSNWGSDYNDINSDSIEIPFLTPAAELATTTQTNSFEPMRFSKSALIKHGINPTNAVMIIATGNSMEPAIPEGSSVGVDTGNTQIKDGNIYAIEHHGKLRIKVLYNTPAGGIRIRSYNTLEWPDEIYDNWDGIVVIGRVFSWTVLV